MVELVPGVFSDKSIKPQLASDIRTLPRLLAGQCCHRPHVKTASQCQAQVPKPPLSARESRGGRHPRRDEQPLSARAMRPPCSSCARSSASPRPRPHAKPAWLPQCRANAAPEILQAPVAMERDSESPKLLDAWSLLVNPDNFVVDHRMEAYDKVGRSVLEDLSGRSGWAGNVRPDMLDRWVPQPSPCCAVASVASAFNIIRQCDRKSDERATVHEVASILASHCEKMAAKHQDDLERNLGATGGMLPPIFASAEDLLEQRGYKWSALRGQPEEISIYVFMLALLEVLENMLSLADRGHAARTTLKAILSQALSRTISPFISNDAEKTEKCGMKEVKVAPSRAKARPSMDYSPRELPRPVAPDSARKRPRSQKPAVIICELKKLLSKRCAMYRLRSERPRTTEIGSWGVAQASKDLFSLRGSGDLVVEILLGNTSAGKKAAKIPVQSKDDAVVVGQQWEAFKAAFETERSVLVFHLKNHYALVFGWREWCDSAEDGTPSLEETVNNPKLHRQILTARKGQQPSAWLEFDEVRDIVISWEGYQIMHLRLVEQKGLAEFIIPDNNDSGEDEGLGSHA